MDYPPLDFISQSVAKLTYRIFIINASYTVVNHVDIDLVFVAYKEISDNGRRKINHKLFTESIGCADNNLAKFIFERYRMHLYYKHNIGQYEWNDFFQFVIIICFFPGDWFIRYVASFIGIEHDRQELDLNEVAALTSLLGNGNLMKNANEKSKPLQFPLSIIRYEHMLAETPDSIQYLKSLQSSVTNYVFSNSKKAYEIYQRRKKVNYKRVYVENHHGELPPLTCKEYMKKLFSKSHHNPYVYDYEISGNSEKETLYLVLTYYRNKFSNLCRIKKNSSSSTNMSNNNIVNNNNNGNTSVSKSYRSLNKSITHLIAEECSNGVVVPGGGGLNLPNSSLDYRVTPLTSPSSHNLNFNVSPLSPLNSGNNTANNSVNNNNSNHSNNNNNVNNNNNNNVVVVNMPAPTANTNLYTGIKKTSVVPISYRAQTACTGSSSRATVNLDPFNDNDDERK